MSELVEESIFSTFDFLDAISTQRINRSFDVYKLSRKESRIKNVTKCVQILPEYNLIDNL